MTVSRARPTEFPVIMPNQPFRGNEISHRGSRPKSLIWRKFAVMLASILLTVWAIREMFEVLSVSGLTILEWTLLVIFTINISWVCFAFVNASFGFIVAIRSIFSQKPKICQQSILQVRTVIAFPIYNEDVEKIFATVLATARSLSNAPGYFECFILSDTNTPEIALQEEAAFERLRHLAPSDVEVRYRRRTINRHRKAGNIRDFVTRWGGRYDYMIVFDADSYMERETILGLVSAMQAAPKTGLIQTLPELVGAKTLFAHTQQFASTLYGPVLGRGIAWWAQKEGNFWGHNAIVRVRALAEAAGLPEIPGRAPFGGAILSHDFVEAALLRRAGWNVEIRPEFTGSYEQGPPTIIDLVARDRRWCQGNMQHMAVLLRTRGFTRTSRFHLFTGIFSYLSSPLWLLFITVGMLLSLQNSFMLPSYFGDDASLFPTWPVIDSERSLNLFIVTMSILFAPKFYGLFYGILHPVWRKSVGIWRTVLGFLSETFLSVLTAPVMMVTQTSAVISILVGRDSGWSPQQRGENGYTFWQTFRHNIPATVLGVVLTGSALAISPIYAAWLAPATVGLILSAPVSYWTAQRSTGSGAALVSPSDVNIPAAFQMAQNAQSDFAHLKASRLISLLLDQRAQQERLYIVDPYWPLERGEVHAPLALARARLEKAVSVQDYVLSLSRAEKMALLNSSKDLQNITFRFFSIRTADRRSLWPAGPSSGPGTGLAGQTVEEKRMARMGSSGDLKSED